MPTSNEIATDHLGLNQAEEARTDANPSGNALPRDMSGAGVNVHIPRRVEENPQLKPGAAFDIDAGDMPQDGVVAIDDSDEALLEEEKRHPISDFPGTGQP